MSLHAIAYVSQARPELAPQELDALLADATAFNRMAGVTGVLMFDGERFLQTGLTLQLAGQEQVDLIKLYMPHVRSRLLLLLSSKKASEILTAEGKNKLAQEIINTLNQPFSPGGPSVQVMSVLFTSFVVQ